MWIIAAIYRFMYHFAVHGQCLSQRAHSAALNSRNAKGLHTGTIEALAFWKSRTQPSMQILERL